MNNSDMPANTNAPTPQEISNCCDAERWLDLESDICSSCREHADFIEEDESVTGVKTK